LMLQTEGRSSELISEQLISGAQRGIWRRG